MSSFIEGMKAKYTAVKTREAALEKQARVRIPAEYQDFLLLLDQNQKLSDKKVEKPEEDIGPSVWSSERGTYVPTRLPYLTVDGRVRWAIDEHKAAGKKLSVEFKTQWTLEVEAILAMEVPAGVAEVLIAQVPQELRGILTCMVDSDIYGRFEGSAKLGWGGREVDSTNPYENAQTSAFGRALGNMGYGLIGTGIASYEEVKAAIAERETAEDKPSGMPTPRPAPSKTGDVPLAPPTNVATDPPQEPSAAESPPPAGGLSGVAEDAALTQTEGPCVDCGQDYLMDKVAAFVVAARKRGGSVRWSHKVIKSLGCEKAASIASKTSKGS